MSNKLLVLGIMQQAPEKIATHNQLTLRLGDEDMLRLRQIVYETNVPCAVLVRLAVKEWLNK